MNYLSIIHNVTSVFLKSGIDHQIILTRKYLKREASCNKYCFTAVANPLLIKN